MSFPIIETRIDNARVPYSVVPIAHLIIPGPVEITRTDFTSQLWEERPHRSVWRVVCGGVLLAHIRVTHGPGHYGQEISLYIPNVDRTSENEPDEVLLAGWYHDLGMTIRHDCGAVYRMETEN